MRLHRIELKNLNSLYGEQQVDLEEGLGDAPVFLILGPTGSGKSTLMDAIALALFGQTPRLSNARGDADVDARNVMSRGTGEAFARLEFSKKEEGRRQRYRTTWSCHRARNKADGTLQDPTRTLERLDPATGEWTVLVSDKRGKFVQPEFDRVLEGLTVKDFQRSMLLAQGEFAAFLKASETERAAILERLTNTSKYREIGERASRRHGVSQKKVGEAEARCGAIRLLSPEQEEALQAETAALAVTQEAAKVAATLARARLAWRAALDDLTARVAQAAQQQREALDREEEHREELALLAEHERCARGAEALGALVRAEAELAKLEKELPEARAKQAGLGEALSVMEKAQAGLREELAAAGAELELKKPEIALATRLRAELAAARTELKIAGENHATRATAQQERKKAEAVAVAASSQAAQRLEAAKAAREQAEPARPLIEQLQALRTRHETLVHTRARLAELASKRKAVAEEIEDGERRLAPASEALVAAGARLAETKSLAESARLALEAELQGAADARARRVLVAEQRKGLAARQGSAEKLEELETQRGQLSERLARAETETETLKQTIAERAGETAARREERAEAAPRIPEARERLDHLRWKQSTARLRSQLREGEACPLCGGTDHPAAEDLSLAEADRQVDLEVAALQEELASLEAALATAEAALSAAEKEEAKALGQLEPQQAAAAKVAEEMQRLAGRATPLLVELGLQAPANLEAVLAVKEALAAEGTQLDQALQRLEDAEAKANASSAGHAKAGNELEQLRAAVARIQDKLESARRRATELENDHAKDSAAGEKERERLVAALVACAVPVAEEAQDAALTEAIEEAERRVAKLRRADEAWIEAEKGRDHAVKAAEKARDLLVDADRQVEEAAKQLAARQQRTDELTAAAAVPLGGADPVELEAALGAKLKGAQQSLQAQEERVGAQRQAHTAAATRVAELERLHLEREGERAGNTEALTTQLQALELPDRKALEGRLLAEARREELAALRAEVQGAVNAANTTLADRTAALATHRAATPEGLDESVHTVEPLREASLAAEAGLEQQTRALAEKQKELTDQAEAQASAGKLREELEQARREHEVWAQLHHLIGRNDGEHFKNFAQLLNLQDLLGKANDHLRLLAPRYALVPGRNDKGEPRLSFAVRDSYHADDVRPLSTLSGGETFLASLALALALADYRTVRMPIETLLLDEGFGTLDPETLQVAMNALSALNAAGTQVGIISHVEGLSERIDARIVVERIGNGRSRLRVEARGA